MPSYSSLLLLLLASAGLLASSSVHASGSAPVIAWKSASAATVATHPVEQTVSSVDELVRALSNPAATNFLDCQNKAVVLYSQQNVHFLDISKTPSTSPLFTQLQGVIASSQVTSLTVQDVPLDSSDNQAIRSAIVQHLTTACTGKKVLEKTVSSPADDSAISQAIASGDDNTIVVANVQLPAFDSDSVVASQQSALSTSLSGVTSLYLGGFAPSNEKLSALSQSLSDKAAIASNLDAAQNNSQTNATLADRPWIQQYRIFTPVLLMSLVISLILIAILGSAMTWITAITNPAGLDGGQKRKVKTA
ncbi:hypothetical protein RI367_007898 [Sorochytrium milnesiophthora]